VSQECLVVVLGLRVYAMCLDLKMAFKGDEGV